MADKESIYPLHSQLQYPNGAVYVYTKVNFNAEPGTYIELDALGAAVKFKGGMRFPRGLITETVPEDWFTWVLAREGQDIERKPEILTATAKPTKPIRSV